MRRGTGWVAAVLAVTAAGSAGVTFVHGGWRVPDHWNPFAPLTIAEEPGWFTRYKLAQIERDPASCRAALATSAFHHVPVPDSRTGPGCGYANAVRVDRGPVTLGAALTLSCPLAVSLARWEHHVVQPAAQRHFGVGVGRLDHLGSYACRNVDGRTDAPRSEHATANAVDIAAFVLADGRRITLARDWQAAGTRTQGEARAGFLRDVRDGACGVFDAVLSPDYNAAHADHLHLDRGPYRVCR